MRKDTILVVGANGQIGSVLTNALKAAFHPNQVIASDIKSPSKMEGRFVILDITDKERLVELVEKFKITQIYHLAAILSAKGEAQPTRSWEINMAGLLNVLEVARTHQLDKVFFPSSIAVFGPDTPKENTPQNTILNPTTVYGISKLAGEKWCAYYHDKYGIDVRSIRYPGIIGHESLPGGGTTDYAVDIFHYAVQNKDYTCFLDKATKLPMLYMPDAVRATLELMETPKENIKTRTSYNLAGMSFSPNDLVSTIQKFYPNFQVFYQPDFRQAIADSWSDSIDDKEARLDWNWKPDYNISQMTADMIHHLKLHYFKKNRPFNITL